MVQRLKELFVNHSRSGRSSTVLRALDCGLQDQADCDFEQLAINHAPLTGLVLDRPLQSAPSDPWVCPKRNRREMDQAPQRKKAERTTHLEAPQNHCDGECNELACIREAEVLRTALSCKKERVVSSEKFLASTQAVFAGFEDSGEVLTNTQKTRLLFQKIQSPSLAQVKSVLKAQLGLDVGAMTITRDFVPNSLAAEAASSPDCIANCQASGLESQGGKGSAAKSGVKGTRRCDLHRMLQQRGHEGFERQQVRHLQGRKLLGNCF